MTTKHYFVYAHSAKGYIDLLSSNLASLNKLFILKGGPGTGKLPIMSKIASSLEERKIIVEYIHSPSDPEALDGILVPTLGIGILDGTPPHEPEQIAQGASLEYINLEASLNTSKLDEHSKDILRLTDSVQKCFKDAYTEFAKALKVHDEWEKIYIQNMDFVKTNQFTDDLIPTLLQTTHFNKPSCIKHRFFGGSTPYGLMDFVENITSDIATRYFIKGRPGSGKSTMMKKILKAAEARGIDVEVYHCGFDPDSLDMLLFPELDLCIFDSTAPHEYYPNREGDRVIDMYANLIREGTDERYEKELADITTRYKSHTQKGTSHLADARSYLVELEQLYNEATDFSVIDKICNELYRKIVDLIK